MRDDHGSQYLKDRLDDIVDLSRKGHMAECIEELRNHTGKHPEHAQAWGHLGYLLLMNSRPDEAIPCYQRLLKLRPDIREGYKWLGDCYLEIGSYRKARSAYRKVEGTQFMTPEARDCLVNLETRPLRALRQVPRSACLFLKRIPDLFFWKSLGREAVGLGRSISGIRAAGYKRFLIYLNAHYLEAGNYRFPTGKCDLCAEEDFRTVFFHGERKILKCQGCGLECVERKPPDGADVAEGVMEEGPVADHFDRIWENTAIWEHRFENMRKLFLDAGEPFPGAGTRVFEVGCGKGHVLKSLADQGMKVSGIETLERLVQSCREEIGLDVRQSTIRDMDYPSGSFDLILAYHVAEHLDKPSQLFEKARAMLREGGVFLMEVPIPDLTKLPLAKKIHGQLGYGSPTHMHFFQEETVRMYYKVHGFRVVGKCVYEVERGLVNGAFLGKKE